METTIAAARPSQTEPVIAATAPAAKAAPNILPSRPISTMPARSQKSPPSAARTSGVAWRKVAASSETAWMRRSSLISALSTRSAACGRGQGGGRQQPGERAADETLERAAEQDDQPLDDDDELALQLRHLEGE